MSTETPTDIESRVVWISQNPSAEEYLGAYPYVPATFAYHLGRERDLAIKERDEAVAKLSRIKAVANADEEDLNRMRDGTKLTRSGIVEALACAIEERDEARAEAAELRDRVERIDSAFRRLPDPLGAELSAAINSLPEMLRQYIHTLETDCDPAGTIRECILLKDQVSQLSILVGEKDAELARLRAEVADLKERLSVEEEHEQVVSKLEEIIAKDGLEIDSFRAEVRALREDNNDLRIGRTEALSLLKSLHEWFLEKAPEHYKGCGLWIDVDITLKAYADDVAMERSAE